MYVENIAQRRFRYKFPLNRGSTHRELSIHMRFDPPRPPGEVPPLSETCDSIGEVWFPARPDGWKGSIPGQFDLLKRLEATPKRLERAGHCFYAVER